VIIDDDQRLSEILQGHKKAVLLEPNYRRKYQPLGLAKIASFLQDSGIGEMKYQRTYDYCNEDLICITSLFTYDSDKVMQNIAKATSLNPKATVVVGGIFASLMSQYIDERYPEVYIYRNYSKMLDQCLPKQMDWGLKDPWDKWSHVFTTRGCPNRCKYCAVPRLEPDPWTNPTWKDHILPDKPFVMISDNNITAQPHEHLEEVCKFLIANNKRVCFDNGFDCKYINPEFASLMSKLKFAHNGMRMVFDRIEEDGIFQNSVRIVRNAGVKARDIQAFVLFNFDDTPPEAIYRAEECIALKLRVYPMQFTPLNKLDRNNRLRCSVPVLRPSALLRVLPKRPLPY
jgi:hypothetical protein